MYCQIQSGDSHKKSSSMAVLLSMGCCALAAMLLTHSLRRSEEPTALLARPVTITADLQVGQLLPQTSNPSSLKVSQQFEVGRGVKPTAQQSEAHYGMENGARQLFAPIGQLALGVSFALGLAGALLKLKQKSVLCKVPFGEQTYQACSSVDVSSVFVMASSSAEQGTTEAPATSDPASSSATSTPVAHETTTHSASTAIDATKASTSPSATTEAGTADEQAEEGPASDAMEKLQKLWNGWGLLGLGVGLLVVAAQYTGVDLLDLQRILSETEGAGEALSAAKGLMDGALPTEGLVDLAESVGAGNMVGAANIGQAAVSGEVAAAEAAALGEVASIAASRAATVVLFAGVGSLIGSFQEQLRKSDADSGDFYQPVGTFIPGETREAAPMRGKFKQTPKDRLDSAVGMGARKFAREVRQLLRAAFLPEGGRTMPAFVSKLTLSNDAVWDREHAREQIPTALVVKVVYEVLCRFIDVAFDGRPIARFWFLETVARMPYFAYMTTLHLYETLGWWRSPELRAVHQAEEDNESHHLMIMEALGGDVRWSDRFLAQHGAIFYYWLLVTFFFVDPKFSYNFSRLLEMHAVDTYGQFVDENAEELKKLPAPPIAVTYYRTGDLYMFDKFQTGQAGQPKEVWRRPPCSTLYDVFCNIRDDEWEHVKTMTACEDWVSGGVSPVSLDPVRISPENYEQEIVSTPEGREAWKLWSEKINEWARSQK